MSTELVERLRAQMGPLKLAADIARSSPDGFTYLNDASRSLLLKLDQSVHEIAIAATAAESANTALTAKVALLTEALKPFAELADKHHSGFTDDAFAIPLVTVGHLRAARALSEPDKEGT